MIKTIFIHALGCAAFPGGIVCWLSAKLMQAYPPRWPNIWYGYRTPASVKTKESFHAANTFSAALLEKYGMLLMIGGLLIGMMFIEKYAWIFVTGGVLAVLVAIAAVIIKTEKHLSDHFDKLGRPR